MSSDREMIADVLSTGVRAAVLLRGVMLQKVDRETLEWGLEELHASELLERYFHRLVASPERADLLNILHLLWSLSGQLDFQVQEYGFDSLKDDLAELNASLARAADAFDMPGLREVM
ncbi:MAG: hypothetical protein HY900_27110 [Deltaproteobacteria bacterium]|nr:hypothetical protein [Deltaproteobacteria bacterium]